VTSARERREQMRQAVQRMGGRVIASYWTQGAYDTVTLIEGPDEETVMALVLAGGMQGTLRSETLRAFDDEEIERILQKLPPQG
jgi:uncharacterized protein with GYD domain